MDQIQFLLIKQESSAITGQLRPEAEITKKAQRIVSQAAVFQDVMSLEKTMIELNSELFNSPKEVREQLTDSKLEQKTKSTILPLYLRDISKHHLSTPNQMQRYILGLGAGNYLGAEVPKFLLGYLVSNLTREQLLDTIEERKVVLEVLLNNGL